MDLFVRCPTSLCNQPEIQNLNCELNQTRDELTKQKAHFDSIGLTEYDQVQVALKQANEQLQENNATLALLREEIQELEKRQAQKEANLRTIINKIAKNKSLYEAIQHAIDNYFNDPAAFDNCKIPTHLEEELELVPTVTLHLNHMNVADLRKAYRANDKQIESILSQYATRYTTKANRSIYQLMVIALRAELQNILAELKYEKLDSSIEKLKLVSSKYLAIAGGGNQSIAGTLTKFIGEIEYLFINAIKIEYNYYVKKEQARQEQLAIREQMRQEAEERKALDLERKKIEKEEEKFQSELDKVQAQLSKTQEESEVEKLNARILELQSQLANVVVKKDEIINLQNGKAGTVYIISNLGSFGKNVFKVGMTRRLVPQERINELGDASVPFKFDVHSFIFSEDAVALEGHIHAILDEKRLNKVNRRKEFFNVSLDELEQIVLGLEPTAEFVRTMAAEEYYQSLSSDQMYSDDDTVDLISDDSGDDIDAEMASAAL